MKQMKKMRYAVLAAAVCTALTMGTLSAAENEATDLRGDTVEYSMNTGVITAKGNVVMKKGTMTATGAFATYNSKTEEGLVTGSVTADKETMHMTADSVRTAGKNRMIASGNVHGIKDDKTFTGPQADYSSDTDYLLIPSGGTITSPDGIFTADYMEGWLKTNYFKGTGNAHIVSPPKHLEAGGDQSEYFGQQDGKAILTGNAWAIQDNNTLRSNRLVIYLANDGSTQVADDSAATAADSAAAEE